jgi:hypothetical protein
MDDWREKLAGELLGDRGAQAMPGMANRFAPGAAQQLAIALGYARTEVSYLLALGRTNNLQTTGNVLGDDVWLQIGHVRLRFLLDRARGALVVFQVGREEVVITYDGAKGALVLPTGEGVDMKDYVRKAIESTVAAWKQNPTPLPGPQWPANPPRARIHGMPPYDDAPPPGNIDPTKAGPPAELPATTLASADAPQSDKKG